MARIRRQTLLEAIRDGLVRAPVVSVLGPRQSGKTTLAREIAAERGATFLDLEDPRHVIGQLEEPLLIPAPDEREGYVPNVVYTCGGLVHNRQVIIPYGFSDMGIAIATVPLDDLLSRLQAY